MALDLTTITNIQLPAVAIDALPLPYSDLRVVFSKSQDLKALKVAEQYQNLVVLLIPADSKVKEDKFDIYYKRALIAKIILNAARNTTTNRVKFEVLARCDVNSYVETNPSVLLDVTPVTSYVSKPDDVVAITALIRKEAQNNTSNPQEQDVHTKILTVLDKKLDTDQLTDVLANIVCYEEGFKLRYLFELDSAKRLYYCYEDICRGKLFEELEIKIDENVRRSMTEAQQEYYLREKMRAIQEELGDKAKKDQDIEDLRKKIYECKMPESTEKKALTELSRYQMIPSNSPESGIIKTYLDFIISLPWHLSSEDSNDILYAKQVLDEDHYGLEKVKERILEYLAVKIMTNKNPQTILCLVGPPGVGKTSLAKSIARALNKKFIKQSLGGVKDESEIRGHRRTYLGALPGRILQSLSKAKTNNPLFLLDEIDKMSSDYKGDPTSAMLEVLDSEQNQFFSDNYLEEPFDLSHCFFLATANYLENIPAPLRDRLEIVHLSSYTEFEKFEICKTHLLPKQLKLNGLSSDLFTISDQAIYKTIQKYTREAGVRELERLMSKIIRKSIKKILVDKLDKVSVDAINLEEFLGKEIFENTENLGKDLVGVVTGLAYTEFGGDTLQIEVAHFKGNGVVKLTGKLGDVMKESAETALSYVKANAEKFGIDEKVFKESDIHIHVPEGATPKDGPSAGVTMVTAIVSAFTNKPVDHFVGMTGEITLRGRVLPIGGLREKSIAAHRSGLKKILVPKENLRDLDEVPQSVKDSLEIIAIETAEEALKIALK